MEQLESLLSEKFGLSPEQSQQAVQTVLNFLKDKLPENVQPLIDSAAKGESIDSSLLGDLADKLSDFFKGK